MSALEYSNLASSGGLSIRPKTGRATPESFVTQNPQYIFQLAARHPDFYQVLVVFKMQVGTKAALTSPGATSNDAEVVDPSLVGLP
jgi:hypothetical protein